MTDDLDAQLRASLREEELPAAPDSIAAFIAQLPTTEALLTQNRGLRSVTVVVVAVALIAAAAFGISGLDRAIGRFAGKLPRCLGPIRPSQHRSRRRISCTAHRFDHQRG